MNIIIVLILLAIVVSLIPKPTKSNRKPKKFGEGMFADTGRCDEVFDDRYKP